MTCVLLYYVIISTETYRRRGGKEGCSRTSRTCGSAGTDYLWQGVILKDVKHYVAANEFFDGENVFWFEENG